MSVQEGGPSSEYIVAHKQSIELLLSRRRPDADRALHGTAAAGASVWSLSSCDT
jgi:hypothetical protein